MTKTIAVGAIVYLIVGMLIVYGAYYIKKRRVEYSGRELKLAPFWYFRVFLILLFYPLLVIKYCYEKILDYLVFEW